MSERTRLVPTSTQSTEYVVRVVIRCSYVLVFVERFVLMRDKIEIEINFDTKTTTTTVFNGKRDFAKHINIYSFGR